MSLNKLNVKYIDKKFICFCSIKSDWVNFESMLLCLNKFGFVLFFNYYKVYR